ncbi:DUF4255 domain-containing protein [Sungkyunkwania multivorans]|uniref:DUF4255 domain-containing protein n=1 Tax=Sungkyunkwania multivorans TaxID=1173618 RepID=A0ABW3CVG4_9FLAO
MIFEVLHILTKQVNDYLEAEGMQTPVVLDNIAFVDSHEPNSPLKDAVALSLINIEEEVTLKNHFNRQVSNDSVTYKNPIIYLNLYLLFAANRDTYTISLRNISKISEFFQGKKVFTQNNTTYNRNDIDLSGISNFKFTVELYTPTFEEMNFVWSTLGGKQLPSLLYKLSLVEIERDVTSKKGVVITGLPRNINRN